jgi:FkbM family methyltransferase
VDIVRYPCRHSLEGRLRTLLKALEIHLVIDVGANLGQFGETVRRVGYQGAIVSFEPVAEHFAALTRTSRKDPLWVCQQLALGSKEGVQTVHVMRSGELSSFLKPSDFGRRCFPGNVPDHQEDVQVRRLDSLFNSLIEGIGSGGVFLKIDTQGYDLEVLRGASGCLGEVAMLMLELSIKPIYDHMPNWMVALEEVRRRGFSVAGLYPITHDRDMTVIEYNGIFVRTR